MRRSLALAALLIVPTMAPPAFASDGATGQIEMTWGAPSFIGSFGAFTSVDRSVEPTGAGSHTVETSIAGMRWQAGDLKISAGAGLFAYRYVGVGEGAGRIASLALSHQVATTGGGTLAVELRGSRLWEGESSLDVASARLGWSLKF